MIFLTRQFKIKKEEKNVEKQKSLTIPGRTWLWRVGPTRLIFPRANGSKSR